MSNENVLLLKHINTFRYFGESRLCKKSRNSNFTFLLFTVAPTDQDLMEVHTKNKKASKGNRMALNNGRNPQCTTVVNWLLNGHDEHCTEKMMQYFPEIHVFVCCL
jgi:hypothetical protein